MSALRLRVEIPGITVAALAAVLGDNVPIVKIADALECLLPFSSETAESITVRQSDLPLSASGEHVYVRSLRDLSGLSALAAESGITQLLLNLDIQTFLARIEDRLEHLGQSLGGKQEVLIFGAHLNGVKCIRYCNSRGISVSGFIDNDIKKQRMSFCGKPVLALGQVDRDAIIINASGRHCVPIDAQLAAGGYARRLGLMELLFLYDLPFQAQGQFRDFVCDMVANRLKVVTFFLALADEPSRRVLDDLVSYRLTLDSGYARRAASPYEEEFFAKDLLHYQAGEVFADGGAYDGDSFQRFANANPNFGRAYLFEPDPVICDKARVRFGTDKRIEFCNVGLYSRTGELRFSSTGGMDGSIREDGDERIQVVAMDDYIREPIKHLKLDVEGAEYEAIRGGFRHITDDRPKIAVAVYHKASDLWSIPALIESTGASYHYSIRHYSQTMDDSIVYALPR